MINSSIGAGHVSADIFLSSAVDRGASDHGVRLNERTITARRSHNTYKLRTNIRQRLGSPNGSPFAGLKARPVPARTKGCGVVETVNMKKGNGKLAGAARGPGSYDWLLNAMAACPAPYGQTLTVSPSNNKRLLQGRTLAKNVQRLKIFDHPFWRSKWVKGLPTSQLWHQPQVNAP